PSADDRGPRCRTMTSGLPSPDATAKANTPPRNALYPSGSLSCTYSSKYVNQRDGRCPSPIRLSNRAAAWPGPPSGGGACLGFRPTTGEFVNDLTDPLVIEDHRAIAWGGEQRQSIPNRQRFGVVHLVPISVDHRYRKRPEWRPVPERA